MEHPCKGMTKAQISAFEMIAIGENPMVGEKTIAKLLERGVIVQGPDRIFQTALGPLHCKQYEIPIPIHMQWCEWASEQPE